MSKSEEPNAPTDFLPAILEGVSTIFESLGRGVLCLNSRYEIVHASKGVDRLASRAVRQEIIGRPIEDILGTDLFGPDGPIRRRAARRT